MILGPGPEIDVDEMLEGAGIVTLRHPDLDGLHVEHPRPPEDAPIRVLLWYLVRRWCRRTFGGRKARRVSAWGGHSARDSRGRAAGGAELGEPAFEVVLGRP